MDKLGIDVKKFSNEYDVRVLTKYDVDDVYALCKKNTFYYKHCPPLVTIDSIYHDMKALPPNKTLADKYYVGFYKDNTLIAVMDFINAYPFMDYAFIGFFMMNVDHQNKGIGSSIIDYLCKYLCEVGFKGIRLGWVESNQKAENFWQKNGFVRTGVTSKLDAYTIVIADRILK